VFPTAAEAAIFPTSHAHCRVFPSWPKPTATPARSSKPKLWKSPQGTARACPHCERPHPRVGRFHRAGIQALAETCARSSGLPPAASPRRAAPSEEETGFRRAVAMIPATRRSECQTSLLWTRPGFIISAAPRPLGLKTALDRTCRSSRCNRSPGFAVSVSFRVDFV
jgi:hypothetical protein